jgi:hypothetical protein
MRLNFPMLLGLRHYDHGEELTAEIDRRAESAQVVGAIERLLVELQYCQQPMKLIRRLEIVPVVSVFYCARCKHAETKVQKCAAPEAEERAA